MIAVLLPLAWAVPLVAAASLWTVGTVLIASRQSRVGDARDVALFVVLVAFAYAAVQAGLVGSGVALTRGDPVIAAASVAAALAFALGASATAIQVRLARDERQERKR